MIHISKTSERNGRACQCSQWKSIAYRTNTDLELRRKFKAWWKMRINFSVLEKSIFKMEWEKWRRGWKYVQLETVHAVIKWCHGLEKYVWEIYNYIVFKYVSGLRNGREGIFGMETNEWASEVWIRICVPVPENRNQILRAKNLFGACGRNWEFLLQLVRTVCRTMDVRGYGNCNIMLISIFQSTGALEFSSQKFEAKCYRTVLLMSIWYSTVHIPRLSTPCLFYSFGYSDKEYFPPTTRGTNLSLHFSLHYFASLELKIICRLSVDYQIIFCNLADEARLRKIDHLVQKLMQKEFGHRDLKDLHQIFYRLNPVYILLDDTFRTWSRLWWLTLVSWLKRVPLQTYRRSQTMPFNNPWRLNDH